MRIFGIGACKTVLSNRRNVLVDTFVAIGIFVVNRFLTTF